MAILMAANCGILYVTRVFLSSGVYVHRTWFPCFVCDEQIVYYVATAACSIINEWLYAMDPWYNLPFITAHFCLSVWIVRVNLHRTYLTKRASSIAVGVGLASMVGDLNAFVVIAWGSFVKPNMRVDPIISTSIGAGGLIIGVVVASIVVHRKEAVMKVHLGFHRGAGHEGSGGGLPMMDTEAYAHFERLGPERGSLLHGLPGRGSRLRL
jgi:hypothetical protein